MPKMDIQFGQSVTIPEIIDFMHEIGRGTVLTSTPENYVVLTPEGTILVSGTGFTIENGVPSGGKIDSIEIYSGTRSVVELSDLSLDISTLYATLEADLSGIDKAAVETLFGGWDWNFNGIVQAGNISFAIGTTSSDGSLIAFNGDDNIRLSYSSDVFAGGEGRDTIYGSYGDDFLFGESGNDRLFGENGNDSLYGGGGRDLLYGGSGNDSLAGASGGDSLDGGAGKDKLKGGKGSDLLDGGSGNDVIKGGKGADLIIGGAGNDKLTGGQGADIFLFGNSDGENIITDFEMGLDTIVKTESYVGMLVSVTNSISGDLIYSFEDTTIIIEGAGTPLVLPFLSEFQAAEDFIL